MYILRLSTSETFEALFLRLKEAKCPVIKIGLDNTRNYAKVPGNIGYSSLANFLHCVKGNIT